MRVIEIFHSLQGEGTLVGVPSVFVRFAGCPFRCYWCDTTYAWDYSAGEDLGLERIIDRIARCECRFIVLTGGEPMVGPDLSPRAGLADLTHRLRALGKHVTIETAGVACIPDLACDLMSISPKLGNARSGPEIPVGGREARGPDRDALTQLTATYPCQLKFVVESPEDVPEIRAVVDRLGLVEPQRVLLMPQARTREELLARSPMVAGLCEETGWRFCDRLQIRLWGSERGR